LGDILKYALSSPQNKMVILQKELQHTQIYVEIQKIRYKDKFEVIWDAEANLQRYFVPKLLLQPLIENSIYHGVREKPGKCSIKVRIRRLPSMISIHVIDNGVGMSPERLKEVMSLMAHDDSTNQGTTPDPVKDSSGNIGLYNTNKRLVLSYGEFFNLRIVSKLGWGTSVQIRIPIDVSS
jgi:two-component system, sensor histidine kinase YesM